MYTDTKKRSDNFTDLGTMRVIGSEYCTQFMVGRMQVLQRKRKRNAHYVTVTHVDMVIKVMYQIECMDIVNYLSC